MPRYIDPHPAYTATFSYIFFRPDHFKKEFLIVKRKIKNESSKTTFLLSLMIRAI